MTTLRPADSKLGMNSQLMLFAPQLVNAGVENVSWVDSHPVNQLTENGSVEFNVSGSGGSYIDLSQTRLYVRAKVVKADGSDISATEKVGVVNLFLHSLWSQIDVYFQQKLVSSSGTNYPYKAMLDVLLNYGREAKESQLQAALYFKDDAGTGMEATVPYPTGTQIQSGTLSNKGLSKRYDFVKESKEFDMVGVPLADIFNLSKYLLNGVPLKVVLFQSKNPFRVMKDKTLTDNFKVILTSACLKVCKVLPSPGIITAHGQSLEDKNQAIYPYMKADIKTFAIAKGSYSVFLDDIYQGQLPSRLVCGLVKSEAFSGSYELNPFNFQNCSVEFIVCKADGQSVPFDGIQTDFTKGNYIEAYESLFLGTGIDGSDNGVFCQRQEYPSGYTLFSLTLMLMQRPREFNQP